VCTQVQTPAVLLSVQQLEQQLSPSCVSLLLRLTVTAVAAIKLSVMSPNCLPFIAMAESLTGMPWHLHFRAAHYSVGMPAL
jgi:hypothetical protein